MSGSGSSGQGINSNNDGVEKDKDSRWYFTSEQLASSPSRRHGIDSDQELSYRQMTAYLIQEMGQRLQVSQLCINTAIVYMHRFYAFHSFTHFHRNAIAAASLFLAAKVEEQPRKLEHVIKAANKCLSQPTCSTTDAYYIEQAQDLVFNENVLLQTLGFDVAIDHPHTHVVKTCHLVKACKDLAQTSYFLASNSLHLTSMCLQYKPTVVACFCIYLACKWSRWEIPQSTEGKHWFHYVDKTVTMDLLKKLTEEFIGIYEKSPARLKSKLNSIKALAQGANRVVNKDKKAPQEEWKMADMMKMYHPPNESSNTSSSSSGISSSNSGISSSNNNNNNNHNNNSNNSTQSLPYAGQATGEQMQSVSNALLPPPPPQNQQQQQQQQQQSSSASSTSSSSQQIRKSDMHSSQHRTHHNSSSSHHHAKIPYASSSNNNGADHKSSHKQQAAYASNLVSRSREHASSSSMNHAAALLSGGSSSQSRSTSGGGGGVNSGVANNGRATMVNSGNMPGQPSSQRPGSTQNHPLDMNYHKQRERNSLLGAPPTSHSSHKLAQKQDANNRKDAMGRITEQQTKSNSSSSNKMYPPNVTSLPPYGSGGANNAPAAMKLEPAHDLTRGLMHNPQQQQQRAYGIPQTQLPSNVPLCYQQMSLSRTGSGAGSNSSKHDQSKSLSVHMQQQQSQSHHNKQQIPADTNAAAYGTLTHETLRGAGNNEITSHADDHSNAQYVGAATQSHQQLLQPPQANTTTTTSSSSKLSMFSPEWQEKLPTQQQSSGNFDGSNNMDAAYNYKMFPTNAKESPRRVDAASLPPKKEKTRTAHVPSTESGSALLTSQSRNSLSQQQLKASGGSASKKLDVLGGNNNNNNNLNDLSGTSLGLLPLKRNNDLSTSSSSSLNIKQEQQDDNLLRESKMRKLDTSNSSSVSGSFAETKPSISELNKLHLVNGIETNPDLVSSLLKESLCTTSGLLKSEAMITAPSHLPPAELLEPTSTAALYTNKNNNNNNNVDVTDKGGVIAMDVEEPVSGKAEKKKKKDKHKHKEKDKDKPKDREERKKHKKDKDRHKERERDGDNAEHVKIKISKEKLESSSGSADVAPVGFKIKIPKERITGELHAGSGGGSAATGAGNGTAHGGYAPSAAHGDSHAGSAPALKIKISKDKLEQYSSGSADASMQLSGGNGNASAAAAYFTGYTGHGSGGMMGMTHASTGSSSGSSKKKDKERDKEKKRSNHDFVRSNGSSNVHVMNMATGTVGGLLSSSAAAASMASAGATGSAPQQTLQKTTQNSSKMQQQSYYHQQQQQQQQQQQHHQQQQQHYTNMSQLFGESNDDDDDDTDDDDDDDLESVEHNVGDNSLSGGNYRHYGGAGGNGNAGGHLLSGSVAGGQTTTTQTHGGYGGPQQLTQR